MCWWSLKAGRATGGGLGYIGFSCSYLWQGISLLLIQCFHVSILYFISYVWTHFEHGQDDMRPHVSISLIDFVGNGLEGGETLDLRTLLHYIVDSVVNYFNHIPKSSWNTKIRNGAVNAFIHLWFVWLNPTKSKSLPFLYISFHLTYSSSFYTHRIHPLLPWECSFPQFCPPCWSDNHSESRA